MKRTITTTGLFIVVFLTVNIAFSQSESEYKSKIEAMNKEMVKDMLAGNTAKILTNYTEDAISLPSYQPMAQGLAAIKKSSEEMAKSGVKFTSFTPTIVKVLVNGNHITEIGTYKISMTVPNMPAPMEDHGKYLTVWEKQKDGSLKVKVETWNSDVDPMSQMNQAGQAGTNK
jgi:ketosteroid isomerase-like protein